MQRLQCILATVLCFGPFAGGLLYGQTDRATIEGIVTDSSKAAIVDAKISVVKTGTNTLTQARSNETGRFFVPNLPIGTYDVTVEKTGFETVVQRGIELRSQASVRVDVSLTVGKMVESISVSGEAPLLDASTPTITTSLSTKQVDELPVINVGAKRNIGQYLQFLPGVNSSSTWGARVNGANGGNSEIFLDGAPASQGNVRGGFQETGPDVETIGEFSIVTNSFNAEYGRTGSWLMNAVIKSGTNDLHGSAYDHIANDAFNARSFFEAQRDRVRQNDAGFTVGGPVVLPKIYNGHNKTFFFFGQELYFYRQQGSSSLTTVPTSDFRAGNFSNFVDGSGAVIPIYDPASTAADGQGGFTRTQFAGNTIPASMISPISSKMVALMVAPDIPSLQQYNFHPRGGEVFDNRVSTIKADHNFTSNQKLALTLTLQDRPAQWSGQGWGMSLPIDGGQNPKNVQSFDARVNYDYIIKPNLLNHLTLGGDGMNNSTVTSSLGQGWDQKLGITGLPADPGMFPAVNYGGGTASPLGLGGTNYSNNVSSRLSLNEMVSWIYGRHTVKFGVNIIRERYADFEGGGSAGVFNFSNLTTSLPDSVNFNQWGSSFASFLLGGVNSTNTTTTSGLGWRINYQSLFAQDEWRATPKLTLSYGLRWERYPGIYEEHDRATSFSASTPNPEAGGIPGALIFAGTGAGRTGSRTFSNAWNGFAPRLGIAYLLTPKTVVRASSGIFFAPGMTPRIDATGFTATPGFSSSDGFTPVYNWANSWPQNWNRPPFIDPSFANGQSVAAILPNASRAPQTISWTLSVQRQVVRDVTVEASYVGSKATHLELGAGAWGGPDMTTYMDVLNSRYLSLGNLLNQSIDSAAAVSAGIKSPFSGFDQLPNHTVGQALRPYPQYTAVTMPYAPEGISSYNALQLKVTKRYSNGLTLLAFYTRSRLMTNDDYAPMDLGEGPGNIQDPTNRRGEYSVSQDDYPNSFGMNFSYELPFGPRKKLLNNNRLLGTIIGGWKLSGSAQRQSGQALSIAASSSLSQFGFPVVRANYVAGQDPYASHSGGFDPATDIYLNPAAFSTPAAFQFGNTSRTLGWLRGPQVNSESLSLAKAIPITERVHAILRVDAQNPFNVVRWSNPDQSISDSNYGKISGTQGARVMQLSMSLAF